MIYQILVLLLAIPTGYLIAYLTKDELKQGKEWFRWIMIISFLLTLLFYFIGMNVEALTCGFILIVTTISFLKG